MNKGNNAASRSGQAACLQESKYACYSTRHIISHLEIVGKSAAHRAMHPSHHLHLVDLIDHHTHIVDLQDVSPDADVA